MQAGEDTRPAYYAAGPGRWRDWWTLLHPPYTAWHLSYAVIGAALAPRVLVSNLIATVLAFFLAVGLAAHALDELRGRPLRTAIPSAVLVAVVAAGLLGALVLGVQGKDTAEMLEYARSAEALAPACTTHFSAVDRDGNMAAVTQTLLSMFGARENVNLTTSDPTQTVNLQPERPHRPSLSRLKSDAPAHRRAVCTQDLDRQ